MIARWRSCQPYKNRLGGIENRLSVVGTKVAELASRTIVMIWTVGINALATIAILGVSLHEHGP
jgi:hypothetical protein